MSRIILIETSASLCSTAIAENGKIICCRRSEGNREHAALTAPFVKEMLDECGLKVKDCDAVCVSSGPGSYTGLRVGSSTAKGLCFGAGIPLLAVCTTDIIAMKAIGEGLAGPECRHIIPMIDARRMEVYSAIYSPEGERMGEIEAVVVDSGSFKEERDGSDVLFVGDGALKCREILAAPGARFEHLVPDAEAMLLPAEKAFNGKRFENIAYFEPFYLKQFVATVSRKNLFQNP